MGLTFDFNQVYEVIEDMTDKMQNETFDKALNEGNKPIINAMKKNISVDTGETKASIGEIKKKGSGSNRESIMGIKSTDRNIIERAYYDEHGTERQVARHSMKKSFSQSKDEAEEAIVKTLKKELGL